MKLGCRLILLSLILCAARVSAIAQFPGSEEKDQIKPTLVADTTAIEGGKPFTAGIRFEIKNSWYTYWRFVGDIGMPLEVVWELPQGFKAGPLQWPLPASHAAAGDFLNYVYEHETMLFAEITPPAKIAADRVTLKAKLTWQVCDPSTCVPGGATVELPLAVGAAQPANGELFAKWRAQIPKTAPPPFQIEWKREKADEFAIRIAGLPKEFKAEFFPLPPGKDVKPGHPKTSDIADDGTRTITFPIEEGGAPNLPWEGVIATSKEGAPREGWSVAASGQPNPTTSAPSSASAIAETPAKSSPTSLLAILWAAFLGGLILNLMPCVLPVIALKIFGFISQASEEPRRVFHLGLAFVAGVFAFFLALAGLVIAIQSGGGRLNWGFQFQNGYILVTLIALVFIFAMSMFGVFEVALGSSTATKLDALTRREGYGGAFIHGLFTTLLGTSCTAPLLGPVLGFAVVQPAPRVLLIFAVIAAGMSFPYFLLTWRPEWMRFLPKPGVWMERLKQFMGFVLLGVVVWLLGVVGQSRGPEAVSAVCGFLLLVGLACWIFGVWHRRILAWSAIAGVLIVGWFGFLRNGFAEIPATTGNATVSAQTDGISWEPFTPGRLAQARQSGRPVFIDFTANWCLNCKYNEKFVLETEPVRALFREKKIVALKADWTNGDPVITEMLKSFNRAGVPVYVIYVPGSSEPIVLPEILNQSTLLRQLAEIKG
jgi:thiol:disulfide interchange protein DsbD